MTDPLASSGKDGPKPAAKAARDTASRQRAILPAFGFTSRDRGGHDGQGPSTLVMPPLEVDPRVCFGPMPIFGAQAMHPLPPYQQLTASQPTSFGEALGQTQSYASNVDTGAWLHGRSWDQPLAPDIWGNTEPLPYDRASEISVGNWQTQDTGRNFSFAIGGQDLLAMQQAPEYQPPFPRQRPVDFALDIDPHSRPDHISPARDVTGDSIDEEGSIERDGRKYQSYRTDGYFLPNDAEEQDRLDLQHAVNLQLLGGRLNIAPVQHPTRALDLMTGTGIWAIQFATQHPQCEVIGTDLALIQPRADRRPANVSFIREDAEGVWTVPKDFDYIHLRLGLASVKDHKALVGNMFAHLRPGGWIEIQDGRPEFLSFDGSHVGAATTHWVKTTAEGLRRLGRDPNAVANYADFLRAAGFVDIREEVLPVPISGWALEPKFKNVGRFNGANLRQAWTSGTSNLLLKFAGLQSDEIKLLNAQCVAEVDSAAVHSFGPGHIIYGRKPLDPQGLSSMAQETRGVSSLRRGH